jgi:putative ABC transport system substrate-binding protein
MRRRSFLALFGCAATSLPVAARAQQSRMPTVGFLSSFTETQAAPALAAIREGLRESGLVEGASVTLVTRYAGGQYERLPDLAKELVDRPVDVILASGRPAPFAVKAATKSIPIVFVVSLDAVSAGLVDSLTRPSGNVTGITHMSDELVQKRLEAGLEAVPKAATVTLLINPESPDVGQEVRALNEVARQRGVEVRMIHARSSGEIDTAFASLAANRPDLLLIAADPLFLSRAAQLTANAAQHALPTIYPFREFSAPGGLIAYGTHRLHNYRQAGLYVARILRGAKTTDLPVMQPTRFELVINLKTARTLGLDVPPTLLARADEVIE